MLAKSALFQSFKGNLFIDCLFLNFLDCEDMGSRRISYPIQVQTKPKFCDPNLSYMDRVVMEIVETERFYVNDLKEIITVSAFSLLLFSLLSFRFRQ